VFIRKNKNRSGSYSIQIVEKINRRNRVLKTIGSGHTAEEIERLMNLARMEMSVLRSQPSLFYSSHDEALKSILSSLSNADVSIAGPERILGRLYDKIGYDALDKGGYFRHLVISRLLFPGSKLKTVDYLYRFQHIQLSVDGLYRYMDKLYKYQKDQVEQITFEYTRQLFGGRLKVVFYDMTTLYFETDREDEFRQRGFSKDGKHQHPQIKLGIVVATEGYPVGYDIFEGSTFEGHTLIPMLERISDKFDLDKPIIVADAGLLSKKNIQALESAGYEYIIGGRLKNESEAIKTKVLSRQIEEGKPMLLKVDKRKIVISYSASRAAKDRHNRQRGLLRLEKKLQTGKLTKSHINNRGYNKYLRMDGEIAVTIDYQKFEQDKKWDGLKSYLTNTKLSRKEVITAYSNLWHIEKAFRISKTDLKVRPVYHRIRQRIEAHICICFAAYALYKELERVLRKSKVPFSPARAIELCKTMYQITVTLPDTRKQEHIMLKMTPEQQTLLTTIQ